MNGAVRRILLLYSNTGGGHRASAEALRQEILSRNPHYHVILEDILLQRTFWPLSESDRFYFWSVSKAPWFWKALYRSVARKEVYATLHKTLGTIIGPRLRHVYERVRPDLVVSLHPLLNHLPRRVLRRWEERTHRPYTPFVTVITDLTTFHPAWVDPDVDAITVATEEARAGVLRLGAPAAKVHLLGLPLRAAFRNLPTHRQGVRARLGLDPTRRTVLVMGGGQGMGPVENIVQELAFRCHSIQLVVIVGRNRALQERLALRKWSIPVHVLGFVENVHEWMVASDVLVTKAGPGTLAEAMVCGVPVLLYGHIPGQEEGNVAFVLNHRLGEYETDPRRMATILSSWFAREEDVLEPMRRRSRSLAHTDATERIVDLLLEVMAAARARSSTRVPQRSLNLHRRLK